MIKNYSAYSHTRLSGGPSYGQLELLSIDTYRIHTYK
jgi:hypothetical protein